MSFFFLFVFFLSADNIIKMDLNLSFLVVANKGGCSQLQTFPNTQNSADFLDISPQQTTEVLLLKTGLGFIMI